MDGKYCKCRDYVKQKVIGYGGQGTCFCATDRKSEKTFAYKENYRSTDDTKLLAECAMMSQINHDNVVVFLGAVKEDMSKVKLFMELAECELSICLSLSLSLSLVCAGVHVMWVDVNMCIECNSEALLARPLSYRKPHPVGSLLT